MHDFFFEVQGMKIHLFKSTNLNSLTKIDILIICLYNLETKT